ncbi:ORF6N domain-containing protein [Paenimyroides aestuarii]|uniref:ORF6N domain-containing protein n=1 Tax=Paenimyroides aestuarii TaxID=2968490 RepID=A0ABY5NNV0_9FLAO|nr:ORF6N domain-containing protein [Paenimyroides aestuarii]UUV20177.1 ORF6N domain-containing protein [Paenimyroides aestuarii]
MSKELTISQKEIENRIFVFRESQIMLDRDLAERYQVETKVLNQAVKRNIERFPQQFRFQLTDNEKMERVTNCDWFWFLDSMNVTSRSQIVTLNKSDSKKRSI